MRSFFRFRQQSLQRPVVQEQEHKGQGHQHGRAPASAERPHGGVSDGRAYEDLFTQTVNPFKNPSERRWIPVMVDLSAYAGQDTEIVFNTRESGPKDAPDARNDLPLWGAPEIVTR